jgi:hypothetical protein
MIWKTTIQGHEAAIAKLRRLRKDDERTASSSSSDPGASRDLECEANHFGRTRLDGKIRLF